MEARLEKICSLPMLSVFTREEIKGWLQSGELRLVTYKGNSVLHLEGETCTKLEVLISGEVVVDRIDPDGGILSISRFREEDVLGASLLFASDPNYILTVSTVKDTELLEFSKESVLHLCNTHPQFLEMVLQMISNHASLLGKKLKNHVERSLRDKIMSYLKLQQQRQGSDIIQLLESKKALAERFGVQRTSLSRELKKMKDDGMIDYDAKTIQIILK